MTEGGARRSTEDLTQIDNYQTMFVTNLKLLGFCESPLCIKGEINVHLGMFARQNSDAFHAVMYFLFGTLDQAKAREKFRDCWPVYDRKTEANFRRVCSTWLEIIAGVDEEAAFPGRVGPLLLYPTGRKFEKFLVQFTSYVMYMATLKMAGPSIVPLCHPKDVMRDPALAKLACINLKIATSCDQREYHALVEEHYENVGRWTAILNRQIDLRRKISEDIKRSDQKIKLLKGRRHGSEDYLKAIQDKVTQLNRLWTDTKEALAANAETAEVLSSFTNVEIRGLVLDGKKLQSLKRDLDAKDVNLLSFVRDFEASMKLFIKEFKANDPLPALRSMMAVVNEHANKLTYLENFKSELKSWIEDVGLATCKMEEKVSDATRIGNPDIKDTSSEDICDSVALDALLSMQVISAPKEIKDPFDPGMDVPWTSTPCVDSASRSPTRGMPSSSTWSGSRRSRSPLLHDPLPSPVIVQASGGSYLETRSPIIETGTTHNRQWTKVSFVRSPSTYATGPPQDEQPSLQVPEIKIGNICDKSDDDNSGYDSFLKCEGVLEEDSSILIPNTPESIRKN